jgi:diguanylate cyclase (GGDEF)-like protein
MARKREEQARSGRTVLVIDDNAEYLEASRRLVEREGHTALAVDNPHAGLALLRERDVDLVLVDYLMPGMTGEELIREMRTFRATTQVILQTGYANEHPPREMLRRMDIQGYHDKSDGPDKLAMWIDVGLKAAYSRQLLVQSRMGLRYVLDATPALHRIQPLGDLLQGILLQTAGLLGAANSFLAAVPAEAEAKDLDQGFLAIAEDEGSLSLRAATGRFRAETQLEHALDPARLARVMASLGQQGVTTAEGATVAPLRVGARTIGFIYLDQAVREAWETELVEVFANQAAVAIQNVSLYEMAALDALTGVTTRRFFEKSMLREVRGASRTEAPLGVLLVDVDRMKSINDGLGHTAGDRALAAIGACLRGTTRATDVVGRIGGDEFAVLLPFTDAVGTATVAARIREALSRLSVEHEGRAIDVRASVGEAVLESTGLKSMVVASRVASFVEEAKRKLMSAADERMYASKRGDAASIASVRWTDVVSGPPSVAPQA